MLRADRDLICAELRSGKRQQGHGRLERIINGVSHFCCLGVMCDIFMPEQRQLALNERYAIYADSSAMLPEELITRLNLEGGPFVGFEMPVWRGDATWGDELAQYSLTNLNDNARLTLEQIADMFEYFFEVDD